MSIIITNEKEWKDLTKKITNAQIFLDRLKESVKIGQRNITKLRDKRKQLEVRNRK